MAEANEEEVVEGLLPFTLDSKPRLVPELKWRANREWQALLKRTFTELVAADPETPEGQAAMADAERQLVIAYDRTGALGDLEDATEREIDTIYNRLIEVAFPLAQSATSLMVGIVRAAAASARANSMSGPSPTGASVVPLTSRPRSRTDRSSSSTGRRRSA